MTKASEARERADAKMAEARESNVFKHAIKQLENDINNAAARGEHEICYNACYFDICPCSSLQKDEYATQADRNTIKSFMEENGYEFFFHSKNNTRGLSLWFTCRW